ncbi:hypothetical protein HPP92_014160 [Vanilla planifolia]|uniref:Uncharacterized protein n=1 Tax=Vanilla planifolia TaxID=51239 RepID=A0A835QRD6_VANPL|nr:hypothetical protein HPP92_014160 [Vanilla planifolia]
MFRLAGENSCGRRESSATYRSPSPSRARGMGNRDSKTTFLTSHSKAKTNWALAYGGTAQYVIRYDVHKVKATLPRRARPFVSLNSSSSHPEPSTSGFPYYDQSTTGGQVSYHPSSSVFLKVSGIR